jgi:hypothetical protein
MRRLDLQWADIYYSHVVPDDPDLDLPTWCDTVFTIDGPYGPQRIRMQITPDPESESWKQPEPWVRWWPA